MPPTLAAPRLFTSQSVTAAIHIPSQRSFSSTPCRAATFLRRPKRPYTFTQLITLSDGSSFTHRTTSPVAVYKSAKDVRNTPMWNPSNSRLANVEEDEAGKLRAFRKRFGRGWDAQEDPEETEAEVEADGTPKKKGIDNDKAEGESKQTEEAKTPKAPQENLMDLIGSFSTEEERLASAKGKAGDYRTGKSGKKAGKK